MEVLLQGGTCSGSLHGVAPPLSLVRKNFQPPWGFLGTRVSKSLALLVPAAVLVAEDLTVLPSRLWMEALKAGSNSGTR